MADDADDISVRFGADTAGVEAGSQAASAAIGDFGAQVAAITEAISAQTEAMSEGFAQLGESIAASMEAAAAATEHEEEELQTLIGTMREGVAQVAEMKEGFEGAAEAFLAFFAVEEISEWVEKLAEATEHAEQLGQRLGMTTADVQGWQAVAELSGRSADQFTQAMTRLTDAGVKASQGSKEQAAALADLGISAQEALNPQQMMLDIADKYQAMGEGGSAAARKIADAMVLMGRSGADMIPILDKGRAGIEAMMEKGVEYGTVVDASVNQANVEAAEKLNELKLAFAGLSETVFSEIVPSLTVFIGSVTGLIAEFSHAVGGGEVFKQALNDLKIIVAGVGAALVTFATVSLATTAVEAIAASNAMRALALSLAIEGEIGGLMGVMKVLGGVLLDLAMGAIPAAIAGLQALTVAMLANPATALAIAIGLLTAGIVAMATAETDAKKATDDLAQAKGLLAADTDNVRNMTEREYNAHVKNTQALLATAEATLIALNAKRQLAQQDAAKETAAVGDPEGGKAGMELHSAGALGAAWALDQVSEAVTKTQAQIDTLKKDLTTLVTATVEPTGGVLPKGPDKKEKKSKDDTVSEWQEQLKQKQDAQENWYVDQNQLAVDFWTKITKSGEGSAKDQKQAYDALQEAKKALDAEGVTSAEEAAKRSATAAGSNVDLVKQIYAGLEADLIAKHAQGGAAWKTVEDAKAEAVEKAVARMRAEQVKLLADQTRGERSDAETQGKVGALKIEGQQQTVKSQASMGQINPQQEMSQLQALAAQKIALAQQNEDQLYEIALAGFYKQRSIEGTTPEQAELTNGQIRDLQQSHYDKLDVLAQQSSNAIASDAQAKALLTEQHWQSMFSPVASGFASMTEGMLNHTESFAQGMEKLLDQMLNRFIEWGFEELAHHAATEAAKSGATDAGVAQRLAAEQVGHTQGLLMSLETTLKQITNAAAAAAAQAYNALAGIPIIGPELGAAAAVITFTAVEAYGAMASAAGGYDIPSNLNPITQLHASEMVLPASLANPLRNIITAGAGRDGGATGVSGGSRADQKGTQGTHDRLDTTNSQLRRMHSLARSKLR